MIPSIIHVDYFYSAYRCKNTASFCLGFLFFRLCTRLTDSSTDFSGPDWFGKAQVQVMPSPVWSSHFGIVLFQDWDWDWDWDYPCFIGLIKARSKNHACHFRPMDRVPVRRSPDSGLRGLLWVQGTWMSKQGPKGTLAFQFVSCVSCVSCVGVAS